MIVPDRYLLIYLIYAYDEGEGSEFHQGAHTVV